MPHYSDDKSTICNIKCYQTHLINLNCSKTSQLGGKCVIFFLADPPNKTCTYRFSSLPIRYDEMCLSLIPSVLEFERRVCQERPVTGGAYLLPAELWLPPRPYRQSTHLHSSEHHTLNCSSAPPPPAGPFLGQSHRFLISAYVPHSWIDARVH